MKATVILAAFLVGSVTTADATIINGGFESGEFDPWVFMQGYRRDFGSDAGGIVEATGLPPGDEPGFGFEGSVSTSSGRYMAYLSTGGNEITSGLSSPNWIGADIDGDGIREKESSQLSISLALDTDATVLVDLDFLIHGADIYDLFGVAHGAVSGGDFDLLMTYLRTSAHRDHLDR